jgi:CheY-like chemotaxis protein
MQRLESTPVDAVTGYPIRADVMPGHLKVGWSAHFRMPVYVMATGAAVPGSRAQSVAGLAGSTAPRLLGAGGHATVSEVGVEELAGVAAGLQAAAAASGTSIALRDASFLRWRLARPGASYVCAVADGRRGRAFAIARETHLRDVPALALLDLMSDDAGATRALLRWLRRRAHHSGLPVLAFCANSATARRLALGRLGLVRSPVTFRFIARPTGPDLVAGDFERDAAWHLTWLDADTL